MPRGFENLGNNFMAEDYNDLRGCTQHDAMRYEISRDRLVKIARIMKIEMNCTAE
jgi:hypothetical protein